MTKLRNIALEKATAADRLLRQQRFADIEILQERGNDSKDVNIRHLLNQNNRLREVADAARNLAHHVRRSLDAGPLSKSPAKEAHYWRELRLALQALDNPVDGI